MLISQILKTKGAQVFSCAPQDTLAAAAALLHSRRVGAMVVIDQGRVAGILSERDVVRAVAVAGEAALSDRVAHHMTADVVFARPEETVDALLERMTDRRIRHLPICEDDRLLGVVSIGDLVKSKIAETVHEAETLKAYIVSG